MYSLELKDFMKAVCGNILTIPKQKQQVLNNHKMILLKPKPPGFMDIQHDNMRRWESGNTLEIHILTISLIKI